jgi:hypothetical protein
MANEKDIKRLEKMVAELSKKVAAGPKPAAPATAKPTGTPQQAVNLKNVLPPKLRPGNVGWISDVVWGYGFNAGGIILEPGRAIDSIVTVTQEAAFIMTKISQTTYIRDGAPGAYTYEMVDYHDPNYEFSGAYGLKFTMTDAQSGRSYMTFPEAIDNMGSGRYPYRLPTPLFFLPNSTIVFRFQNDSDHITYLPYLTLWGVRIRLDEAGSILSTLRA